jgi:lipocalin
LSSGWVDTPGVEAAYGSSKSYLEPLRTLWEGSEGIVWLLVTPATRIESGGFYLDRKARTKHMAGPFFSEGSFTKNTPADVEKMMEMLELWSALPLHEGPLEDVLPDEKLQRINREACEAPLMAMHGPFDIQRYMGTWHVQANIPTFFDKDTINNVEEYTWNEAKQRVDVIFKYASAVACSKSGDGSGSGSDDSSSDGGEQCARVCAGATQEVKQKGELMNVWGTEWALSVKLVMYLPVPARYLVLAVDLDLDAQEVEVVPGVEGDSSSSSSVTAVKKGIAGEIVHIDSDSDDDKTLPQYTSCMIGVPDRSALWIMSRDITPMSDEALAKYSLQANLLGYDVSKIGRVPVSESAEGMTEDGGNSV